jgi:hypothetical protein
MKYEKFAITIDIMSVNTLIPIRNERVQQIFLVSKPEQSEKA